MQAAERVDGERPRRPCYAAGSVTSVRMKRPSSLVGHRLAPGDVDVGEHDVGALSGQMSGDPLTDAVAAPGDQCDLAVDVECHDLDRRGQLRSADERGGEGLGVDDTEVLDRTGHGHVEEPEAPAIGARNRRRLDHDDGVEFEPLGRRRRDDGDRAGSWRHARAGQRPGSPPGQLGRLGRRGHQGRRPPPARGPRPAQRASASAAASQIALLDVADGGIGAAGPDGRGGLDTRGGHGQQPRGEVRGRVPGRGSPASARRDARGAESGRWLRTSSQSEYVHGPVAWARSPRMVTEPDGARRATMRNCIGVRSCASSTTMWP